jgi:hypothetical protein
MKKSLRQIISAYLKDPKDAEAKVALAAEVGTLAFLVEVDGKVDVTASEQAFGFARDTGQDVDGALTRAEFARIASEVFK